MKNKQNEKGEEKKIHRQENQKEWKRNQEKSLAIRV